MDNLEEAKHIALEILEQYQNSEQSWIDEVGFGKPAIIAERHLKKKCKAYKIKIDNHLDCFFAIC